MKQEDFPTPSIWYGHRISYGETDTMGITYYAEYLHIFERARDAYIRLSGFSYNVVEERGILLPVRECHCRYRIPSRFDDVLWCRVGVAEWGRASITFAYQIRNEDRTLVHVTGMTQHATTDKGGKPVRLPSWLSAISASVPDGELVYL